MKAWIRRSRLAAGMLALVIGLFGVADRAAAQWVPDVGTVIQTLHTSTWSPPSPDPVGITWRPDSGELLTCDSEVEETGLFVGVNLWAHSTTGVVSGTASTTAYSAEPTGIAFDPAGGRLWITDDNQAVLFEVDFGADGVWGNADDSVVDLDGLVAAGCDQLADVTYNNLDGHLYVASAGSQEICEIDPGANGFFDGAAPTGDDQVSTFSVTANEVLAPEGIVYDPFWNTLVLADRSTRDLYEVTPEGGLLRQIDVNFPGGTKPSGVTIAPSPANPSLRTYWVTDRRVDNNANPLENDGRIYEVVALPLGGNGAPVVDAGPPQILEWPANSANLSGFVSDDGHPYPPSVLLSLWSKLSGPGSVTFGSQGSPVTTVTFSAPGEYVLQLVGDDSQAQSADTLAVTLSQRVTLSMTPVGPGSVTLDPPGGSYDLGQTVSVTAAPGPDAGFVGWSGDLAGAALSETLVMDGDKSVTASFTSLYAVTLAVSGPGAVTLDPPGGSYPAGTTVSVSATPDPNAVFDGFSGDLSGTASPQLLVVDADKSVSASFSTPTFTLSLATVGQGSVSLDPPGGTYPAGASVTLTAIPAGGWVFGAWSGDVVGSGNPLLLVMDANQSVTARFDSSGGSPPSCGVGPELAALMPLLGWLYGRRRRA